jgi:hypothetical protein
MADCFSGSGATLLSRLCSVFPASFAIRSGVTHLEATMLTYKI